MIRGFKDGTPRPGNMGIVEAEYSGAEEHSMEAACRSLSLQSDAAPIEMMSRLETMAGESGCSIDLLVLTRSLRLPMLIFSVLGIIRGGDRCVRQLPRYLPVVQARGGALD